MNKVYGLIANIWFYLSEVLYILTGSNQSICMGL